MKEHDLDPRDLGIPRATIDQLVGGDAAHNAAIVHEVLAGERGPGARHRACSTPRPAWSPSSSPRTRASSSGRILDRFRDKMAVAEESIDSGAAARKLEQWIAATKG